MTTVDLEAPARASSTPALPDTLSVRGARVHNLRGVDLDLPHRSLIVFTGVSGSGKSSLAFDTIYAEAQRRQVQSMTSFARQFMNEMEKPDVDRLDGLCSAVAVDQRSSASRNPRSTVGTVTEVYDLMRVLWATVGSGHCTDCAAALVDRACPAGHDTALPDLTGPAFSFNLPFGRCPACLGLGSTREIDPALVVPDESRSIDEGAVAPWRNAPAERAAAVAVVERAGRSTAVPWRTLPSDLRETLLHGVGGSGADGVAEDRGQAAAGRLPGVIPWLERRRASAGEGAADPAEPYLRTVACPDCAGARLNPAQAAVRVGGLGIAEACALPVADALRFFAGLTVGDRDRRVIEQAVIEITDRLTFLIKVGLGYLTLGRTARTLSGGEAQRIRLAGQLGTRLFGLLYVLDEPTVGLHPEDTAALITTLRGLRDLGNTLIVVEHDHAVIRAADRMVELGPAAGELGGRLMFAGTAEELLVDDDSLTGRFLRDPGGATARPGGVPRTRRTPGPGRELVVRGARANNLRDVDVTLPLGMLVAVSGVSGAGKSTLVDEILCRAADRALGGDAPPPGDHDEVLGLASIDRVIRVDQSPIGRSARSTPATYTGILDTVRKVFAQTDEARRRGFKPGRFSFNSPGGRCAACSGDGTVRVEMGFLPDVFLPCDVCHGARFDDATLAVRHRGRSIADVLAMSVDEAAEFFADLGAAARPLRVLAEVGLGYLRLGQPGNTLSGGEAQRIKLANELQRRPGRHTLYLLDEPTTGLHSSDVARLAGVLHDLVAAGHSVVAVSHSMEVVAAADWVVDLGPGGGADGGLVVAEGTPEAVAAGDGATARHLRGLLRG
ncbi:excinuclease ABC subunit A [Actinoalloteichus hoggarensis]|uniref:UvrABC system protein A n=1 Tax=Actinoalloteichus hoggarensis TaxID=1470176 RepID=A0A221W6F2_9PSEU|nr:excinuclease ABC subunit UvrA [Actinoalloteichus hoggarensis]ASO20987.1 UvrABC system protein A [Actinoalloteichus hoggarensis]MBB5920918.1 excinuclease ABC subunit A [Actinoalloteichus hoggarensis]